MLRSRCDYSDLWRNGRERRRQGDADGEDLLRGVGAEVDVEGVALRVDGLEKSGEWSGGRRLCWCVEEEGRTVADGQERRNCWIWNSRICACGLAALPGYIGKLSVENVADYGVQCSAGLLCVLLWRFRRSACLS